MRQFPRLDCSLLYSGNDEKRAGFGESIWKAFVDRGAFLLVGEPIDRALLERSLAVSRRVFSLPDDEKRAYESPSTGGQRGYSGFGSAQVTRGRGVDAKEYWHVGRSVMDGRLPENIWPAQLPDFRPAMSDLFACVDALCQDILGLIERPSGVRDGLFRRAGRDGNSVLRSLRYPPMHRSQRGERGVRAAVHADIDLFSIFLLETAPGLRVQDADGEWISITPTPQSLLVVPGEMLSRATDGAVGAAMHRVDLEEPICESRYSIVFFCHPRPDSVLVEESEEGVGPVIAEDYLRERIDFWSSGG